MPHLANALNNKRPKKTWSSFPLFQTELSHPNSISDLSPKPPVGPSLDSNAQRGLNRNIVGGVAQQHDPWSCHQPHPRPYKLNAFGLGGGVGFPVLLCTALDALKPGSPKEITSAHIKPGKGPMGWVLGRPFLFSLILDTTGE